MARAPNAFAFRIQTSTLLRMSVAHYIWSNVCMHFFHEEMVKNIFITTVSLPLECGEVKAFVEGSL